MRWEKSRLKNLLSVYLYVKEEMRKTMTKPVVSKHIQMTHEEIIEDNRKGAAVVLELLQQTGKVDIG